MKRLFNKFLPIVMLLICSILGTTDAWANTSHSTHYGKVTVAASGSGSVYIGTTNTAKSGKTMETWNCSGNQSSDSKTYYLFATPDAANHYYFEGWYLDGTNKGTASPYTATHSPSSTTNGSPTTFAYTANFELLPKFYFAAGAEVDPAGNGTGKVAVAYSSTEPAAGNFSADPVSDKTNVWATAITDGSKTATAYYFAKADAGMTFMGWYDKIGTQLSTENPYPVLQTSTTKKDDATPEVYYARFRDPSIKFNPAIELAGQDGATELTLKIDAEQVVSFVNVDDAVLSTLNAPTITEVSRVDVGSDPIVVWDAANRKLTANRAGTVTVTFSHPATEDFHATDFTFTITVEKHDPQFTWASPMPAFAVGVAVPVSNIFSTKSDGNWTLTSSNTTALPNITKGAASVTPTQVAQNVKLTFDQPATYYWNAVHEQTTIDVNDLRHVEIDLSSSNANAAETFAALKAAGSSSAYSWDASKKYVAFTPTNDKTNLILEFTGVPDVLSFSVGVSARLSSNKYAYVTAYYSTKTASETTASDWVNVKGSGYTIGFSRSTANGYTSSSGASTSSHVYAASGNIQLPASAKCIKIAFNDNNGTTGDYTSACSYKDIKITEKSALTVTDPAAQATLIELIKDNGSVSNGTLTAELINTGDVTYSLSGANKNDFKLTYTKEGTPVESAAGGNLVLSVAQGIVADEILTKSVNVVYVSDDYATAVGKTATISVSDAKGHGPYTRTLIIKEPDHVSYFSKVSSMALQMTNGQYKAVHSDKTITVTPDGEEEQQHKILKNSADNATLTATADLGYAFKRWIVVNMSDPRNPSVTYPTSNPYNLIPTVTTYVSAEFEPVAVIAAPADQEYVVRNATYIGTANFTVSKSTKANGSDFIAEFDNANFIVTSKSLSGSNLTVNYTFTCPFDYKNQSATLTVKNVVNSGDEVNQTRAEMKIAVSVLRIEGLFGDAGKLLPADKNSTANASATFDVKNAESASNFRAVITDFSNDVSFSVDGISYDADAEQVTVNYSYDPQGMEGTYTAILTLTAASGLTQSITITADVEVARAEEAVLFQDGLEVEAGNLADLLAHINSGKTAGGVDLYNPTLQLANDVAMTAAVTMSKSFELDLHGKKITTTVNKPFILGTAGTQYVIKDSREGGAIIGTPTVNGATYLIQVSAVQTKLTINGGLLSLENLNQSSGATASAIYADAPAEIVMNGGTIDCTSGYKNAYAIRNTGSASVAAGVVTINGGTINAKTVKSTNARCISSSGIINIHGGVLNASTETSTTAYGVLVDCNTHTNLESCYAGELHMDGGTINAMPKTTTAAAVYANGAYIVTTDPVADGTHSHRMAAEIDITGGTLNVTTGTGTAYGVYALQGYNSKKNAKVITKVHNCEINVSATTAAYGIKDEAACDAVSGGVRTANFDIENCKIRVEARTGEGAYGVSIAATGRHITTTDPGYYPGEYAGASTAIIRNCDIEAKALAGRYAYAVVSGAYYKTNPGNAEAYTDLKIYGGSYNAIAYTNTARAVNSGGNTTIVGGTFNAQTQTANAAYALFQNSGTMTVTDAVVNARAYTKTAYGVYAYSDIKSHVAFPNKAKVILNNVTSTAITETAEDACGVRTTTAQQTNTDATFAALSAANQATYGPYYAYGEHAVASDLEINGGTFTATAATTTAYGICVNTTAVGTYGEASASSNVVVRDATIVAKTEGEKATTSAYGIHAGGNTTVENCHITVQPKTTTAYGVYANDKKCILRNNTFDVKATATAYGVYANAALSNIGWDTHGEVETYNNTFDVTTTSTTGAYGIYTHAATKQVTNTAAGYVPGDYAAAATAEVDGDVINVQAQTNTAYALCDKGYVSAGTASATPSLRVLDGKFKSTSVDGTKQQDAFSSTPSTPGISLLGGFYKFNTDFGSFLSDGRKVLTLPNTYPEYNEGYRYQVTLFGDPVCKIGNTQYATLEEALQYANANTGTNLTIVMIADYTLPAGNYVLPANATLLVPYKTGTGAGAATAIGTTVSRTNTAGTLSVFKKLTFAEGVNMTVKGKIEVSAQMLCASGGAAISGCPTGPYGQIHLREGAKIDLESGSFVYAWGYITGNGLINAKKGSTIYEDFQLGYWRGGSASMDMTNSTNKNNYKAFFVTDYAYQNIECPIVYRAGSIALGSSGVYAASGIRTCDGVRIFGTTNSLFTIDDAAESADTWVRKEYNASEDRLYWTLNSGASIANVNISLSNIPLIGTISMDSKDYNLPITTNFTIVLNDGRLNLTNDMLFMPGSQLIINKEATAVVASGKKVYFYDSDDWQTTGGKYYYPVTYSPSWGTKNPRVTKYPQTSPLPDAEVFVHGAIECNGRLFTTGDGSKGSANIHSTNEDAGSIVYTAAATADGTVGQCTSTGPDYVTAQTTSAQLKNGDGTYTKTSGTQAGYIYEYENNQWVCRRQDGCLTVSTDGSGDHYYAKPSDVVEVAANTTDEAYHSVDNPSRYFIFAENNVKNNATSATSTTCYWWEVDHIGVIDGVNYYMANQEQYDNYGTYYYYDNSTGFWKPKYVTVTWKNWDGSQLSYSNGTAAQDKVLYNVSPRYFAQNPTRANDATWQYAWTGWDTSLGNTGAAQYDKNEALPLTTGDMTYYAHFDASKWKYAITFKNSDGTILETKLFEAGETPAISDGIAVTKEPSVSSIYVFDHWSPSVVPVTGVATYTATYSESPRPYTIRWENADGTLLKEEQVNYGSTPNYTGATPVKASDWYADYTHNGWTPAVAPVGGDRTYTATYAADIHSYTITWRRATLDETEGEVWSTTIVNAGETPVAPADYTPERPSTAQYNYELAWPELGEVRGEATYQAYWKAITRSYDIYWRNADGSLLEKDEAVLYGTRPSYNNTTPKMTQDEAWVYGAFTGWEPTIDLVNGETTYTATYAKTPRQYDITWIDENSASHTTSVAYGDMPVEPTAELPVLATGRERNWSPAIAPVDGEQTYTASVRDARPIYTITWKQADGSTTSIDVREGDMPVYYGETPTKTSTAQYDYTFSGWSPVVAAASENQVYEAQFDATVRTYTVRWFDIDGIVMASETYEYGATPVCPDKVVVATPAGYILSWEPEIVPVTGDADYTFYYTYQVAEVIPSGAGSGTKYMTLAEAFVEANKLNNATVRMLHSVRDINASISVTKSMTIDLNGYVIDGTVDKLFNINGTNINVTLTDSREGGMIRLTADADAVVNAVYVTKGALFMENGRVEATNVNAGGTAAVNAVNMTKDATFTMNGGSLYGWRDALRAYGLQVHGTTIINGGTIAAQATGTAYGILGYNKVLTVHGGTINATTTTTTTAAGIYMTRDGSSSNCTLIMDGGTINAVSKTSTVYGIYSYYAANTVNVSGNAVINATAQTSSTSYGIFGRSTNPITVSGNATVSAKAATEVAYTIYAQDATNLSGNITISAESKTLKASAVYMVKGALTIDGGTYYANSHQYNAAAAEATGTYTIFTGTAVPATISNATIEAVSDHPSYGTYVSGVYSQFTTTITNCDITATAALQYPYAVNVKAGTTTINGGTYRGISAQNARGLLACGTLIFNGGTVTAQSTKAGAAVGVYVSTDNVGNLTFNNGDVTAISKTDNATTLHNQYAGNKITVNGGKFMAQAAGGDIVNINTIGTVSTLNGGYYSHNTNLNTYKADGKSVQTLTSGTEFEEGYNYIIASSTRTVTFKNGEDVIQNSLVELNTIPQYSGVTPTKATDTYVYIFSGWTDGVNNYSKDEALPEVTADVIYTATFDKRSTTFQVTFSGNGHGSDIEKIATCNTLVTKPSDPIVTGYTFGGWYRDAVCTLAWNFTSDFMPEENLVLYAKWTPNDYVISYDANYPGAAIIANTTDVTFGTAVGTLPKAPVRDGYTFNGWFSATTGGTRYSSSTIYQVASNSTLYAQWTINNYVIRWYDGDAKLLATTYVDYGQMPAYTGTTPTKTEDDDYTYTWNNGWTPAVEAVVDNVDYTATFDAVEKGMHTVTFYLQGHGNAVEPQVIKKNTLVTEPNTVQEEVGYTFGGWYKEYNCINKWNFATDLMPDNDLPLYAKWTINKYTVRFENEGGALLQSVEVEHGQTPAFTEATPTKAATAQYTYTFTGWDPAIAVATENATYTATFKATANKYTITFANIDGNGGTSEVEYEYGATPSYDGTPTKAEDADYTYEFTRWDKAFTTVTETATYTAQFEAHAKSQTVTDITAGDGDHESSNAPVPVEVETTATNVTVQSDGIIEIGGEATLTVTNNFVLTADAAQAEDFKDVSDMPSLAGASGQVVFSGSVDEAAALATSANVYFDLNIDIKARTWYAVSVPWQVDANTGIAIGTNKLRLGVDEDITYYDGAARAQHGPVTAQTVKYLEDIPDAKDRIMQPGTMYFLYFAKNWPNATIRFTKKSGTNTVHTDPVNVTENESQTGNDGDGGWNGISNPKIYSAYVNAGVDYGYVFVGGEYVRVTLAETRFAVGTPVMVQVEEEKTVVINRTQFSPATAPMRSRVFDPIKVDVFICGADGRATDRLTLKATEEEKADEYVIGQDLAKMSVSTKKAQLWVDRYASELTVNTQMLENGTVEYPIVMKAPVAGQYTIRMKDAQDVDANVYLTYEGMVIWNLSMSSCPIDLPQGNTTEYGIRINTRRINHNTTGLDEAVVDSQEKTQKIMVNGILYIVRGGQVYDAKGNLLK